MGGFFSSKKAPPPPPPAVPQVIQDLINGVETVTEDRDGQKVTITRQLPLTPEQQKMKDDITGRLDRIDALSSGLAVLNPDYKPMVDALKNWQIQTRGQLFGEAARAQQDELARRGLSNSTAAAQSNALLALQQGQQVQQDELNLFGLAEEQRTAELGRLGGALQLRRDVNQQNLQNLSAAGQATSGAQQNRLSLDSQMQQQAYSNQLNAFQAQKPSMFQNLLNTGVQLGTGFLVGGGSIGSLLGSKATSAATGAASTGAGVLPSSSLKLRSQFL